MRCDVKQVAAFARRFVSDPPKPSVAILDNILTAHGRTPFDGPRKVLVDGLTGRLTGSGPRLAPAP